MKTKKRNSLKAPQPTQCEGWRRHGGIFTLGPVTWTQCKANGVVMLTVEQNGKVQSLPACNTCWQEVIKNKITILKAKPILAKATQ